MKSYFNGEFMVVPDDQSEKKERRSIRWWLHKKSGVHKSLMRRARANVRNGYWLTENGQVSLGWEFVQEAIRCVVVCGCPREAWPEDVREAVHEA